MKLGCVIVFAKDLVKMRAFYEGGLGLKVIDVQEGWVKLEAGGASVALHAIPGDIAATIEIADPPAARERTPLKLVFDVDDLEATLSSLRNSGGRMFQPRRGARSISCDGIDPEGNVFNIAQATG